MGVAGVTVAGVAGFWQKLRRGKIVQWGVAYSAAGWVLLQGIEFATSTFHWQQPIQQHATLTLLVGLPIVLVLAWYHGDRGEQHFQRTELAVIALLALMGGVLVWRYEPEIDTTAAEDTSRVSAPAASATVVHPRPAGPRPVVAVLPFANPGVTADDRSLADGLQSDILAGLSRNHLLDVVAASSVEQFRDMAIPVAEIGQTVGATHVLEGSVQRAGNRMRIQGRLIDARTARQVWAEAFDREFEVTKLFAVQGEIVLALADALRAGLTDVERSSAGAALTQNIDAWAMEKTARTLLEQRTTESIIESERLFREAIALDPEYARAYSGLADAVWLKADYTDLPLQPAVAEAERLLSHALRLDPNLVEALTTRAKLAQERFDFATAEAVYRQVFELNPSYARAYHWYSQLMFQQGRRIEAIEAMLRAVNLDPMSLTLRLNMGLAITKPHDPSDALAWMEKAGEIDPTNPAWAWGKAFAFSVAGRHDEALHWVLEMLELAPASARALSETARHHLELDNLVGARSWLAHLSEDSREVTGWFGYAGLLDMYAAEPDQAVEHARRGLALDPYDTTALMVLDAVSLRRGDPAAVVAAVQFSYLDLAGPGLPQVRHASLLPATDLALALQLNDNTERSRELLDAASVFLAVARRNGAYEYFIDEVRVAAIRGDHEAALEALGELIANGWRGPFWRFYRDHDPALDGLRESPRFQEAFAVVEQDIRSQRERAEGAGDLGHLPPDPD
jgi:TolB-like protein/Tfp pilus assembly protein PilF